MLCVLMFPGRPSGVISLGEAVEDSNRRLIDLLDTELVWLFYWCSDAAAVDLVLAEVLVAPRPPRQSRGHVALSYRVNSSIRTGLKGTLAEPRPPRGSPRVVQKSPASKTGVYPTPT